MVVYIFTDGNVKIVSPENIYQGSTVSEITLLTPFPSTTSLSVGFVMPDGTKLTAQPMNYTQTIVDGQSVTAYTYTLPYTVTEQAGEVQMAFAALFSNGTQTSYMARFEVQESVLPEPPAQPDENTYELILQYAQTAMQNAANAQSAAEAAQTAAESAEDKAAAAETTAGQANATANAANTTAGQANTKADQAVTTSNNAAATAAAANQTAIEAKSAASAAQSAAAQAQEDADAAAKSASAAETSAGEAADSAEEAVTTAQGAATTANEAKTTADGIDGKATQALSNSEQAVTTANEAKALAEQAVAGAGTEVYVDNALQSRLDFTSDPQTQINDKQTQIDNIESGVTKVGAAGQADKLATARNLKVNLASGAAQAFDGSDNAENIGVGGVLSVANGGTGASNLNNIKVGSAGSADQAAKLSTARNLQVNVASGNSQAFDGSADATEIGVKGILPVGNGGTGAASLDNIKVGSAGSADQAARATADGGGNNIENTYETKTNASSTYATKNEVSNISNSEGLIASAGWHTVAQCNILNGAAAFITVHQEFNNQSPNSINLSFAQTGYGTPVLNCLGVAGTLITRARYVRPTDDEPGLVQIYYNASGVNYWFCSVISAQKGDVTAYLDPAATTSDTSVQPSVTIDTPGGCSISTSSDIYTKTIYSNGARVFNGTILPDGGSASGTVGSLTLPGYGWYVLYANYQYTGLIFWTIFGSAVSYSSGNSGGGFIVNANGVITAAPGTTVTYYRFL